LIEQKDAPSPAADLVEMQCLWFLVEDADMHLATGNLGMALKRYHEIQKVRFRRLSFRNASKRF